MNIPAPEQDGLGVDIDGCANLEARLYVAERMLLHHAAQKQSEEGKQVAVEPNLFHLCLQKACHDAASVGLIPEYAIAALGHALRDDIDFYPQICYSSNAP